MTIEHWPLTRLTPYCRNLRRNDPGVEKMVASISTFGFKIPILALSNGEIVDGHLRLKAAQKIGIEEVPVVLCDEWSEAKVKAFRLMVNRSATWADFDPEQIALELEDLKDLDFDLSLTGFDAREIDEYLFGDPDQGKEDEVPTAMEHAVARAGDLWILGSHRLLCGDATSAADVERLFGPASPALMITDPPYGMARPCRPGEGTPVRRSGQRRQSRLERGIPVISG